MNAGIASDEWDLALAIPGIGERVDLGVKADMLLIKVGCERLAVYVVLGSERLHLPGRELAKGLGMHHRVDLCVVEGRAGQMELRTAECRKTKARGEG